MYGVFPDTSLLQDIQISFQSFPVEQPLISGYQALRQSKRAAQDQNSQVAKFEFRWTAPPPEYSQRGRDPYPTDGLLHCDSHRSMCLAILSLTALTAAGDEQFEESPDQCITSEHSHLKWVINQEVV